MISPGYLAAWIESPDGVWFCRHCGRELGNGHPSECPISKLDYEVPR
jgi:rubrerythrin